MEINDAAYNRQLNFNSRGKEYMINQNFDFMSYREYDLANSPDGLAAEELTEIEMNLTEFDKKIADIYCQLVANRVLKNYYINYQNKSCLDSNYKSESESESEFEPSASIINMNLNQELFQSQLLFEPQFKEAKGFALSEAKKIFFCASIYDSNSALRIIPKEIILNILRSDIEMTISLDICHKIASLHAYIEGKKLQEKALQQLKERNEASQDICLTQKDKSKEKGRTCIVS